MAGRDPIQILRRGLALTLALTALASAGQAWAGGAPSASEYTVKAAYLSKFGAFVDWPPNAFASPNAPIVICVVGEDPFGPVLDQTVGGQKIGPRGLEVRRMERVERGSGCQILYLGLSRRQSTAEALKTVQGAPVLTVTDGRRSGPPGIIDFTVTGNHVRFSVDPDAAAQCGLTISSKLLSVAVAVRNKP